MKTMASQNETNEIQELHAYVVGWVQGVGYRYFVVNTALSLGIRGYVRNLSDGNVEVLAQGTRPNLERLLAMLQRGPSAAEVHEIRTRWGQPTEHLSGFHVRW
ncbi:MAG TPA: acylphosphatase [Ktedonobacteraceae bacterium]|nr:acylphosphatase [Ktedonobacteraceae bacterium]